MPGSARAERWHGISLVPAQFALALAVCFLATSAAAGLTPGTPSPLTAVAAMMLAGTALATALLLVSCVAGIARAAAIAPVLRRTTALRTKAWGAAFLRLTDPDAPGRPRPRAPSAVPAAAQLA